MTVPLDPREPAVEGYSRVLLDLLDAVEHHRPGALDRRDEERLHDMRVALRRSRTVVANGGRVLPGAVRERFGGELKWLADATSTPRDLDVYLLEWADYTEPLVSGTAARLDPVRAVLEQQRTAAHEQLAAALQSERYDALVTGWREWLVRPVAGPRGERALGATVTQRIKKAQRTVVQGGRGIDASSPADDLHSLRKDAKRLRYLLECFDSLFDPKAHTRFVKRLKALQDNLGEHQDAEVHVTHLRALARELHAAGSVDADVLVAIGQLVEQLELRRHRARERFAVRFGRYDTQATAKAFHDLLGSVDR